MNFDYGLERSVQQSEYSAFERVQRRIDLLSSALIQEAQEILALIYEEYSEKQIQSRIQKDFPYYSRERVASELQYIRDIWKRLQRIK